MIICKKDNPIYFDVDDTLVIWSFSPEEKDLIQFKYHGHVYTLKPHNKHIRFLKSQKKRSRSVIVWSAGGWEWASCVVKALGIEKYVDVVIEKPILCIDDVPKEKIISSSIYFKDE